MNVLVGITGGIAAYKTASLIRLLIKNGDAVKVIMTVNACEFITPLTMQTLSGNRVYTEMFDAQAEYDYAHIDLASWCECMVIAPASANTIAKLAHGLADNLLTAAALALPEATPLYIAPAMNTNMYTKAVMQDNCKRIAEWARLIDPIEGLLACGTTGVGAMAAPETIFNTITNLDNDEW